MMRILGILLMLAGSLVATSLPVWAQEPVYLRAVEPREGQPGQELELTLWGGGFEGAREVQVTIGGIEVLEAWVESDEVIIAHVFIPEDAPPGPRPVEVVAVFGPNEEFPAGLDEGFFVLEREAPPAPGRPALHRVEPREVTQGSEVELTLSGENFAEEMEVFIGGEGVEVYEWGVESPSRLIIRIGVSADAESGPRLVAVGTEGGWAELPDGLVVIEREAPPGPSPPPPAPPPPPGVPPWLWAGAAVVLLGLGATIGRALTLRTRLTWERTAQLQWQLEATTELPEPQDACTWACKAKATTDLLKRWKVTALQLTPLPLPSGKTPPTRRVEDEVLDRLTEAAQPQYVLEDEARTRQRIAPVVDALLEQILAWKQEGQTPASIRVDARLARDVKCEFALHHCEKTAEGPKWAKVQTWKGTLHPPGGEHLGVLRGPTAGEPDFAARARGELEGFLLKLVKGVRFKL